MLNLFVFYMYSCIYITHTFIRLCIYIYIVWFVVFYRENCMHVVTCLLPFRLMEWSAHAMSASILPAQVDAIFAEDTRRGFSVLFRVYVFHVCASSSSHYFNFVRMDKTDTVLIPLPLHRYSRIHLSHHFHGHHHQHPYGRHALLTFKS